PRGRRSRDIFAVIDDVRDRIQAAVPRLHIEFMQILADVINDLAGAARPVEVKLFGESLDTLEAYARRLAPDLAKIAGVEDLYNGVSEPTAELLMRVNQAEADRVDLTPVDVGNAVAAALLGVPAGEVRVEDRPVAVRVRAPDSVRFDPLRLTALPIVAARGARPTPLGSLASFAPTESRLALDRENQQQMIALVGLIVKNGIILLDFTKLRMRTAGATLETAIREAARVRLRPILMTTLCTLFGLLPLALGIGAGSELQRPLALAVIGGLALSTPITLFAVPTL